MASDTAIMESLDPFLHDEQEGLFLPPDKAIHINPMLLSRTSKTRYGDTPCNYFRHAYLPPVYCRAEPIPLRQKFSTLVQL